MSESLQAALKFLGKDVVIAPARAKTKTAAVRSGNVRRAPATGAAGTKRGAASLKLLVTASPTPSLKSAAIDRLAEKLQVPEAVVLDVSSIRARTFHRRQSEDAPLTATEGDRVLRIARVASEAERVFGEPDKARHWLTSPSALLGAAPLQLLGTDAGAREVEAELGRIDWGDFA